MRLRLQIMLKNVIVVREEFRSRNCSHISLLLLFVAAKEAHPPLRFLIKISHFLGSVSRGSICDLNDSISSSLRSHYLNRGASRLTPYSVTLGLNSAHHSPCISCQMKSSKYLLCCLLLTSCMIGSLVLIQFVHHAATFSPPQQGFASKTSHNHGALISNLSSIIIKDYNVYMMADPLSFSASLLAVLSAGISVGKAFNTLIQGYREAPAAITALSNEVSDLVLVLQEVRSRAATAIHGSNLAIAIGKADARLEELSIFVESLGLVTTDRTAKNTFDKARWVSRKKRARELKAGLKDVKNDIVLLLSASTL